MMELGKTKKRMLFYRQMETVVGLSTVGQQLARTADAPLTLLPSLRKIH